MGSRQSDTVKCLRPSDFFMIAGRAEAKFQEFHMDENSILTFKSVIGDSFSNSVSIHISDLLVDHHKSYEVKFADKSIQITQDSAKGESDHAIEWLTTEKLIWDRSRGKPGVRGFDRYREAVIYDLLYVGIIKADESYERLIHNGRSRCHAFERWPDCSTISRDRFLLIHSLLITPRPLSFLVC